MKNFFFILFGGLAAIVIGLGVSYGGALAWRAFTPKITDLPRSLSQLATPLQTVTAVRYTAGEEEDLINAAAQALPSGADSHISASAYIVKDLTRGDVAAEYNADRLLPIASLSKLVTAAVADRLIPSNRKIALDREVMTTYGNTAGFRVGETFTAGDLMYPLLMVSSNDAAEALARSAGRVAFIKAMNDFTQSIGAYRTYFADPSGLSPENVSTANDLTLILEWIRLNDPAILAITELQTETIRNHTWVNPTHFLSWSYYLGGKNGYTPEADRTAASLFTLGAHKNVYAVIVLGSAMRDADVIKLLAKVK